MVSIQIMALFASSAFGCALRLNHWVLWFCLCRDTREQCDSTPGYVTNTQTSLACGGEWDPE